jgi:hypothetical protein
MKLILATALLVICSTSFAGLFSINNRSCTGCSTAEQTALYAAFDALETEINSNGLPDTSDATKYLNGMANASVMSGKSLGTDYGNPVDLFVVGLGLGIGADLGNNGLSDLTGGKVEGSEVNGIAVNAGLMVGIDMGIFPLPSFGFFNFEDLDLFVNFGSFEKKGFDISTKDNVKGDFEFSNFGLHARYHLMHEKAFFPAGLLKWGGLFVTTGIERNSMKLEATKTITSESKEVTTSGITATGTFTNGTVKFGAESSSTSIPVEISTNLQYLYVFTTYMGLGFDMNTGESTGIANVTGDVSASISAGGSGTAAGTGEVGLSKTGEADAAWGRFFIGQQINIPLVKLYVQLDKAMGNGYYSIGTGLRVTW